MNKPPENRVDVAFGQEVIAALRHIETRLIRPDSPGSVVLSSFSQKFWCTGRDLDEADTDIYSESDGLYPLIAAILDYPYPTIAMLTGHTFGGGCLLSLSCDYRIMNSKRGFISMPPVNMGLHFDGMGAIPAAKLKPQVARKLLLEAHRWTAQQALEDGIVDQVAEPDRLAEKAVELAKFVAPRAQTGVYGLLRSELYGEALRKFREVSHVHRKRVGTVPKAKM